MKIKESRSIQAEYFLTKKVVLLKGFNNDSYAIINSFIMARLLPQNTFTPKN